MQNQHKIRLGYWKIRGLVERIRMILEYLHLPYQETKYGNTEEQKWFNGDKLQLIKKNIAINLPYIVDGDQVISQSDAIIVHLIHKANKTQLLGRNAEQQVLAATSMGVFRDFHRKYIELVYGTKQEFQNNRHTKFQQWKPFLAKLNGLLQGKQYYCGGITWVDFAIAENMQAVSLLEPVLLQQFPNVLNHQKRIWALPEIVEYHKTERWHERPINYNPDACWY